MVSIVIYHTMKEPPSSPIQREAANQQLLSIFTQSVPAAFKRPRETRETLTVERMEPVRRRESVCRSLFGPVDHDQLRKELTLKLKEISEQDSRRWNFNFQSETPLPGRLQWEEIPADCAASFYQEPTPLSASNSEDDDRLSSRDQENCSCISNIKCPAAATAVRRKRTLARGAKPGLNARITDYFAKRRRTTETKSILNHLLSSSSEAAQCKTIR